MFRNILLTLLASAAVAYAEVAVRKFDINAQPAAAGLNEFARQADITLVFSYELVSGARTNSLQGDYSVGDALAKLLEGTSLAYRRVSENTVAIIQPADTTAQQGVEEPMRVAQTEHDISPDTASGENAPAELQEIIVTGSQIRGIENRTAPVIVLDRSYIESTGLGTTEKLLDSVPQNFAAQDGQLGKMIDLRGIGEGTTLTLLNGRRMASDTSGTAVDISAVPLAAIERVEILTDGASALYGADAVGGVVNFILRKDYQGMETSLRTGWADGVNERGLAHTMGAAWGSGHALLSLEYYKTDMLLRKDRDFVPETSLITSLSPQDEHSSLMFHGQQGLTESIGTFADVMLTRRNTYRTDLPGFGFDSRANTPAKALTLGTDWQASQDWRIELSDSYADNRPEQLRYAIPTPVSVTSHFEMSSARVKADGSLLTLPAGKLRAALGADWRSEDFDFATTFGTARFTSPGRRARSAFGELYAPIVGADNAVRGVYALELSVAGRYDDYSDVGSTFNPRFGVGWEPAPGVRLRGSYGTSYVPPRLIFFNLANISGAAAPQPDPLLVGANSIQMFVFGQDVNNVKPQKSRNISFGVDWRPQELDGLQMGVSYYHINYSDKIDSPQFDLADPATYGDFVIRNPSSAQIDRYIAIAEQGGAPLVGYDGNFNVDPGFDPGTIEVILDFRQRNLSVVKTSGFDVSLQYAFTAGGANLSVGLTGTYIAELEQRLTAASSPLDLVDTLSNPPSWRARAFLGWRRQGWAAHLFLDHRDSYTDNRISTAPLPVSSHTTLDARLAYDFSERTHTGLLSGLKVALNAQNIFDADPPRVAELSPLDDGFDAANANPLGRLIGIELQKVW